MHRIILRYLKNIYLTHINKSACKTKNLWYNYRMKLLIPVAVGIEAVVKRQLTLLGYPDTRAINHGIRQHININT